MSSANVFCGRGNCRPVVLIQIDRATPRRSPAAQMPVMKEMRDVFRRVNSGLHDFRLTRLRWAVMLIAVFSSLFCLSQQPESTPDGQTIIKRSVQANDRDWQLAPDYNYFETDRGEDGKTLTYDVMMILGSPYQRLVAVKGEPLSPERQQQEQRKLEQVIAARSKESPRQRAQRIARYEKERKRDHLMMEQLTKAFDFTLEGTQKLGPHEVYHLKATPRPGYQPPNVQAKTLTGMEGQLWVDTRNYQWVKVEAVVIHPVSIEGFLARVEPGTRFELENTEVAEGLWLPKHFAMKANAKILLLFSHREQQDQNFFDYKRAQPTQALSSADK